MKQYVREVARQTETRIVGSFTGVAEGHKVRMDERESSEVFLKQRLSNIEGRVLKTLKRGSSSEGLTKRSDGPCRPSGCSGSPP